MVFLSYTEVQLHSTQRIQRISFQDDMLHVLCEYRAVVPNRSLCLSIAAFWYQQKTLTRHKHGRKQEQKKCPSSFLGAFAVDTLCVYTLKVRSRYTTTASTYITASPKDQRNSQHIDNSKVDAYMYAGLDSLDITPISLLH